MVKKDGVNFIFLAEDCCNVIFVSFFDVVILSLFHFVSLRAKQRTSRSGLGQSCIFVVAQNEARLHATLRQAITICDKYCLLPS